MSDEECEALLDVLAVDWHARRIGPPDQWTFDAERALRIQLLLGTVRAVCGSPVPAE